MRKKKQLLIGIAIGYFAGPIVKILASPFREAAQKKLYDIAIEYIERFDADRPS
jgi:hypothetical protein